MLQDATVSNRGLRQNVPVINATRALPAAARSLRLA
jgi:hypothetical protein